MFFTAAEIEESKTESFLLYLPAINLANVILLGLWLCFYEGT